MGGNAYTLLSAAARPGALVAVQGLGGLGHLGLQYARALPIEGIELSVSSPAGGKALGWAARLRTPAISVDQRVKMPAWLDEVELGHRVVAVARGSEKAGLAAELGAHDYIDSTRTDPGAALQRLGGAAPLPRRPRPQPSHRRL